MKKIVIVSDKMQKGYRYECVAPMAKQFAPDFKPDLTPKQLLALGVFGGKYITDCTKEFPADWFTKAKLSPLKKNPKLNYFGVNASQSLKEWQKKGWIYVDDPRGWFQWYCRYYMGRRLPKEDERQINRWKKMTRHIRWLQNACRREDIFCRPRQRQALLHWAYDSRKL
jgi:hypothetical protein